MTSLFRTLLGFSFTVPYVFAQDHTQCADSGSYWYTSVVGETPCRTYERLRTICNSQYVLGALKTNTPPDTCNDQVADCCCNSIAFGLSMMCLTCQQGMESTGGNGTDAGPGAYQLYLKHGTNSFCTTNTNKSFTNGIQLAVCNNNLRIHDSFYDRIFWADGSWYYTWAREHAEETNAIDGNNSFTHCASTTVNGTSSSESASTLPHSSKFPTAGAIAGIVGGCVAFIGAVTLFTLWLCSYRRRQTDIDDSETSPTPFNMSDDGYTPSTISNSAVIPILTSNPELGTWRRLRMKEQREPPPRYTE